MSSITDTIPQASLPTPSGNPPSLSLKPPDAALPEPGRFQQSLLRNRERLNARYAYARRTWPRLNADTFRTVLRTCFPPVIEALSPCPPENLDRVVDKLYELALELCGRELMGPRGRIPAMVQLWTQVLPRLSHLLLLGARQTVGLLANALVNLHGESVSDEHLWLELLARIGPDLQSLPQLQAAGRIAAWRAGMAQHRSGALRDARTLDFGLLRTLLQLPAALPEGCRLPLLEKMEAEPFTRPEVLAEQLLSPWRAVPPSLSLAAHVGGFRGFGGPFIRPPRISTTGEQLLAEDGAHRFYLFADCYGAAFYRLPADFTQSPPCERQGYSLTREGTVLTQADARNFPLLAQASSSASTGTVLAVTLPYSHKVYLVAQTTQAPPSLSNTAQGGTATGPGVTA